MPTILNAQQPTIEPDFEVSEEQVPDIGNKRLGQKVDAILNYEVIEKTKSFTILRITWVSLLPSRRAF